MRPTSSSKASEKKEFSIRQMLICKSCSNKNLLPLQILRKVVLFPIVTLYKTLMFSVTNPFTGKLMKWTVSKQWEGHIKVGVNPEKIQSAVTFKLLITMYVKVHICRIEMS